MIYIYKAESFHCVEKGDVFTIKREFKCPTSGETYYEMTSKKTLEKNKMFTVPAVAFDAFFDSVEELK